MGKIQSSAPVSMSAVTVFDPAGPIKATSIIGRGRNMPPPSVKTGWGPGFACRGIGATLEIGLVGVKDELVHHATGVDAEALKFVVDRVPGVAARDDPCAIRTPRHTLPPVGPQLVRGEQVALLPPRN